MTLQGTEKERLLGYLLVATGAALWGTLGVVVRILYAHGFTPEAVITLRAGGAALMLLLAMAFMRPSWLRIQVRDLPYFFLYGLVSVAAYNLFYMLTIQRISVAASSVLLYTAPAWVTLTAYLLLGEALTRTKLVALAVTLVGTTLVAEAYRPEVFRAHGLGLLFGLGSGLTYGLYSIFGKYGLRRYRPWVLQLYSLLTGSAILGASFGREAVQVMGENLHLWPYALYLSLLPTLASYGLYLMGLQYIESSHASIVATVEPVVAALLGFLVLAEPMSLAQMGGGVLILGAAVLLHLGSRTTRREDAARGEKPAKPEESENLSAPRAGRT